jgi:hypothetical protein
MDAPYLNLFCDPETQALELQADGLVNVQSGRQYALRGRNQDDWRSLFINAARSGRSSSFTVVSFSASPRPGSARRTTALALICPSWTRNSSLAVEPTLLDVGVSTNRPPRLKFRTRETSSRPPQYQ